LPATLKVTRTSVILELRRAPFQIVLDGAAMATIHRLDTVEAPIEPGHHRLQIRSGRYSSHAESFDAADGDTVSFRCSGARIWPIYLISFAVPSLALTLKRD
jgi:hypothetical protein